MQHHLSRSTKKFKTFVLKDDPKLYDVLMGGCRAQVYWDDESHKDNGVDLYNPSPEFEQLEISYSWGYSGSSVSELSRALLYSIDPVMVDYCDVLTEGFLPYFTKKIPELLVTELEIRQFIDHYMKNKNYPLRADPRANKYIPTLKELLDKSDCQPYSHRSFKLNEVHEMANCMRQ